MRSVLFEKKLITPSKIICIGRNYVDHITELGNEVPTDMVVFLKPNSALSKQLQATHQEPLHYESELCFIYQGGRFTGVGFGLDLTKRSLQANLKAKGLPWERAKAFNGSAVLSSFVAIDSIDKSLTLQLFIDGQLTQQGGVELMIYKPDEILQQVATFLDLEDGDIVMTGTPKGVGKISAGQHFNGKILSENRLLIDEDWLAFN